MIEQNVPHLAPRRRLERRLVFQEVPEGESIWIRVAGEVLNARIQGSGMHGPCDAPDGESWYRLVPKGSPCALILEVAL